jgi:hypothetical protein
MGQKRILRIVVASPSDVQAERNAVPFVLDELNRGIAGDRNLLLELSRWETDAYPGFHPEGPQGLIDPTLKIEDCDVLIGVFWKRFGTPTADAGSGTEHEILNAYRAWKQNGRPQIMVYFNQQAYTPRSSVETNQWGQVLEFRQNFPKEGLWWDYKGKGEFERLLRNHLTQYIRNLPRPATTEADRGGPPTHTDSGGQTAPSSVSIDAPSSRGTGDTAGRRPSKKILYAVVAVLSVLAVLGVAFAYWWPTNRPESPPLELGDITTVRLDDEFLNLNKWVPPATGWSIDLNDGQGRLVIEKQPQPGCAANVVYKDFEMTFNLKLLNDGGAAWALRADKSDKNYYLFYLSGPTGKYPNRFLSYIVRDGEIDSRSERSTEVIAELTAGHQYQIDITAEQNKIRHTITPSETGDKINLHEFIDPSDTLPRGKLCFRTVADEKFSIDDLFASPSAPQPAR